MNQPWNFHFYRRSATSGAIVGVIIVLVGTAMLLDTLGIIPAQTFWEFLPLILVGFGVLKIVESNNRPGGVIFGGLLAAAGAFWFLDNLGLMHFDERFVAPIVLIAVGVGMLLRVVNRATRITPEGTPLQAASDFHQWSIFSGSKRAIDSQNFTGGEAFSIFGGTELDLRRARTTANRVTIDANAIFGGVEIKVPATWSVSMSGMGIFGGYEDKTMHPNDPASAPQLVISGYAIFGGVSVSN